MPRQPLEGAHEIQSFCLGHTAYATASAFVQRGEQARSGGRAAAGSLVLPCPLGGADTRGAGPDAARAFQPAAAAAEPTPCQPLLATTVVCLQATFLLGCWASSHRFPTNNSKHTCSHAHRISLRHTHPNHCCCPPLCRSCL
jgi:tRNA (guanine-N(7)-)-methyltransferase subunit TRM82